MQTSGSPHKFSSISRKIAVFIEVYVDNVTCGEISADYLLSCNSLNSALDKSSERTSTEIRVIAVLNDVVLCRIAYIYAQMLVVKTFLQISKHKIYYLYDLGLCKRLVEDYLIKTVEEFGAELLFEQSLYLSPCLVGDVAIFVNTLKNIGGTEI